jgi:hypothetical protein
MIAPKLNAKNWNRLALNGVALPGVVQKISIAGNLVIDAENVTGSSNGVTIVNADYGEDISRFEMIVTESELKRVSEFRTKYRGKNGERPTFVLADHPLLKEMGIRKCILEKLEVNWDTSMKNFIPVSVDLRHVNPKRAPNGNADGTVKPINGNAGIPGSNEINGQPATSTTDPNIQGLEIPFLPEPTRKP